jgi:SPP1 family predicted phage head-tail adaptor
MPPPTVGELRHRVNLETRSQAPAGGPGGTGLTETFVTGATVWARVELIRGGQYLDGMQTDEAPTHRIVTRFRDDFPTWRYISEGTQRWRVLQAGESDGMRRWVEFAVVELKP